MKCLFKQIALSLITLRSFNIQNFLAFYVLIMRKLFKYQIKTHFNFFKRLWNYCQNFLVSLNQMTILNVCYLFYFSFSFYSSLYVSFIKEHIYLIWSKLSWTSLQRLLKVNNYYIYISIRLDFTSLIVRLISSNSI